MSPRAVSMQNLPRAGRWAIYIALAVVFAIACAFLSNWQFTRNQERSAQLALVAENYDAPPVPLSDLVPADGELSPQDEWHPVILTGTYLPDEQLLVRNRPHGGTSAFEVLVPFRLDDGRVLIVDRGWVPPGQDRPVPDAIPAPRPAPYATCTASTTRSLAQASASQAAIRRAAARAPAGSRGSTRASSASAGAARCGSAAASAAGPSAKVCVTSS